MSRTDREQMQQSYSELFAKGQVMVLAKYDGLTVAAMTDLRRRLREAGGGLKVVKNTLLRRALVGTEHERLGDKLAGPLAVAWSDGDASPLLKALLAFGKVNEKIKYRQISLGGSVYEGDQLDTLSKLPSLPEMRAQLLSVLTAVPRKFVTLLGQSQRDFMGVLSARKAELEKAA